MATEAQLRNRIDRLQSELNSLQREQARRERELRSDMQTQLDAYEARFRQEMQRRRDETEAEYTMRIRRFQEEYARESERLVSQLQSEMNALMEQQAQKLRELEECNAELRRLLRRVREHTEENERKQLEYARELRAVMLQKREAAAATPHRFFFEGEFDVIDAHAAEIDSEIDGEMYQSAIADAGDITLQFELLFIKVNQALREWLAAFEDYRILMYSLDHRLRQLETMELQTSVGAFRMSLSELEFWSSGTYLALRKKVSDAMAEIHRIEEMGVKRYLEESASGQRRAVFRMVEDAKKALDEFTGIANCIRSERILSDERWRLAQETKKMAESLGYTVVSCSFRPAHEGDLRFASGVNPMDCLDMVISVQGLDCYTITFCPVRENGVAVRNECIVTAQPYTICDPVFVDRTVDQLIAEMRELKVVNEKKISVSGIPYSDETPLIKKRNEQLRKKEPSPEKQIMFIQKKYH